MNLPGIRQSVLVGIGKKHVHRVCRDVVQINARNIASVEVDRPHMVDPPVEIEVRRHHHSVHEKIPDPVAVVLADGEAEGLARGGPGRIQRESRGCQQPLIRPGAVGIIAMKHPDLPRQSINGLLKRDLAAIGKDRGQGSAWIGGRLNLQIDERHRLCGIPVHLPEKVGVPSCLLGEKLETPAGEARLTRRCHHRRTIDQIPRFGWMLRPTYQTKS